MSSEFFYRFRNFEKSRYIIFATASDKVCDTFEGIKKEIKSRKQTIYYKWLYV